MFGLSKCNILSLIRIAMNANELRVGNLVYSPTWATEIIVDIENIGYHDDFYPIRITPERLIELGFKRYNDNYQKETLHGLKSERPSRISIKYTAASNWVVLRPANRTIYLHSIHQLQNLYYALTGTELTIKEPCINE